MRKIPVVSKSGEFGTIDESESHLIGRDFRLQTPEEIKAAEDKAKYGTGIGNEIQAGLEGAARGASFGLSDQFLSKSGIVSPEVLRSRAEQNPISSGLGEVAGVVVPSILSEGAAAPEAIGSSALRRGVSEAASIASKPVGAALELGRSASRAVAPAAEKIAGSIASKETSPILNKLVSRGVTEGLGSAVEGAAYGLGQSISEEALGDPDLNAEKVLSNIGLNAVLGGTFGTAFAGGEAFASKIAQKVPTVGKLIGKEAGDFSEHIAMGAHSPEERAGLLDGMKKQKANAGEIKGAADELGVPTFVGQTSDSNAVHKAWTIMSESASPVGIAEKQAISEAFGKVSSQVETVLNKGEAKSLAETGEKLKESLGSHFEAEYKPIKEMYDELQKYTPAVPVTPRSVGTIRANILKIADEQALVRGSPARSFVENVAASLGDITDLNYLKTFRTNLYQNAPMEAKWVAGAIKEKLDNLEVNAIKRFAETMKTPGAKDKILGLIDTASQAKSGYKKLYDRMNEFGDVLGKRRIHGPQDFLDFLAEGNTSERFAEKLFQKKNSAFTEFFKGNFPNEWQIISDFQKQKLLQSAMKDGELQIGKVVREVNKLEPEMKAALFSPEEVKKLQAAKTWMDAFPSKFNPSETSHAEGWMQFLKSPVEATYQSARDYAIKTGFEKLGLTGEQMAQVHVMTKLERAANAITKSIDAGAKAIFSFGKKSAQALTAMPEFADHDHEKTFKDIQEVVDHPQKMLDKLEGSTQWIYNVAPKTAGSLQMASMRAATFLNSKIPKNSNPKPLAPKFIPSPADLAKFNRYFQTIQKPTRVLHSVKMGMITKEEMEDAAQCLSILAFENAGWCN
jgi:hypothetical protein